MDSPGARARAALVAWRRAEADAALAATDDPIAGARLGRAREAFAGDAGLALIDEALRTGEIDAPAAGALRLHAARARARAEVPRGPRPGFDPEVDLGFEIGRLGDAWLVLGSPAFPERRALVARAVAAHLDEAAPALRALRMRVDAAGRGALVPGLAHADAGPDREALVARCDGLLAATDDVVREAVAHAAGRPRPAWHEWTAALRAPALGGLVPRSRRHRSAAADLAGLGLERELGARVRLGRPAEGLDPRPRLLLREPPMDVRLVPSPLDLGVAGELLAAEALGRALAHALAHPALAPELLHPVLGSAARGLGALVAQLVADPLAVRRRPGFDARQAEAVSRHGALCLLVAARGWAAATRLRALPEPARWDEAPTLAARALGVELPAGVARVFLGAPSSPAVRFRGIVGGLGLAWRFRERFDEDWPRNPRAAEPIRAIAARGGGLPVEEALAELGGADGDAEALLVERLA